MVTEYKFIKRYLPKSIPLSIRCDKCGKLYRYYDDKTFDKKQEWVEIQEFHKINFTGGYGSIFGDGNVIECDICQHCLKKILKGKYRVVSHNGYSEQKRRELKEEEIEIGKSLRRVGVPGYRVGINA